MTLHEGETRGDTGHRRTRGDTPRLAIRVLALVAFCATVYGFGLNSMGLVEWQESARALIAHEMQQRGEWMTPTLRGEAYVAKPPMFSWAQIALANAMGEPVGERHLRMVAAIAGTLGVAATYLVGRRMLRDGLGARDAERGAWWGALGLAVALLYVRSSRTGELDILLPVFVVVAVGAFHSAWCATGVVARHAWVLLCLVATIGAAFTKGPPGMAVIAAAMVAGPLICHGAQSAKHRFGTPFVTRSARDTSPDRDRGRTLQGFGGAVVGAFVVLGAFVGIRVAGLSRAEFGAGDVAGLLMLCGMGAVVGALVASLFECGVFKPWFGVLARTHPVGVLGGALVLLWLWGGRLKGAFGADVVDELALRDAANNLNVLMPRSAVKNLGFVAYGMAPIVVATIAGLVMVLRERVRLSRAMCALLAWLIGGFIVYSVAGKGVARYLTPIWPAAALVGGWFIAVWMREMGDVARRRAAAAMTAVVVTFAGAQAWWYGMGRAQFFASESVRGLAVELGEWREQHRLPLRGQAVAPENDVGALLPIVTWQFNDPALDLYLGEAVREFGGGSGARRDGRERAAELAAFVREAGHVVVLAREGTAEVMEKYGSTLDEWRDAGLASRRVEMEAEYVRPPGATRVWVYVVREEVE